MDKWRCREFTQHLFPIEREKEGFQRYRIWTGDTAHTSVQKRRRRRRHRAVYLFIYFHPHKAGDKTVAVGGSEGRVPVSQTHTHQNTSSVLQTTVFGTKIMITIREDVLRDDKLKQHFSQ